MFGVLFIIYVHPFHADDQKTPHYVLDWYRANLEQHVMALLAYKDLGMDTFTYFCNPQSNVMCMDLKSMMEVQSH